MVIAFIKYVLNPAKAELKQSNLKEPFAKIAKQLKADSFRANHGLMKWQPPIAQKSR